MDLKSKKETEAPERIWAFAAPEIAKDEGGATIVAHEDFQRGAVEYVLADRIEALELALTQSRAETAAEVEMLNDADHQYNRRTNDMIARHAAAQAKSRAETAAAYERAAQVDIHYIDDDGEQRSHKLGFFVQNSIRALATPDQTAALDRLIAEAEARTVERIAELVSGWRNTTPMTGEECANAILAAIKGAKA